MGKIQIDQGKVDMRKKQVSHVLGSIIHAGGMTHHMPHTNETYMSFH